MSADVNKVIFLSIWDEQNLSQVLGNYSTQ